jgi:uncharacterized lipoprotein YmbA
MTLVRLTRAAAAHAAAATACAGLVAILALAACSSPPSRFYTLGSGDAAATSMRTAANPALLIEVPPVDVPSQIAKNQLVVQTGAAQVDVLEQERWASPPADEIRRALSGDLTQRLDTIDVFGSPYPEGVPVYRVSVNVQRFESWPASRALIEAVWSVRAVRTRAVLTCRSFVAEPVGAGFDALVAGHRRALDRMSAEIAAGVRALAAEPARSAAASLAPASASASASASAACPAPVPASGSAGVAAPSPPSAG